MSTKIKQRPPTTWEREPVILDIHRTAILLGIHEVQVRRFAREGKIPAFKVGSLWRFEKSRLMEFAGVASPTGATVNAIR